MKIEDINVGDTVWYAEELWDQAEYHKAVVAFKTDKWLVLQHKDGYCYNIAPDCPTDDGFKIFSSELEALKQIEVYWKSILKERVDDYEAQLAKDYKSVLKSVAKDKHNYNKEIAKVQKKITALSKKGK